MKGQQRKVFGFLKAEYDTYYVCYIIISDS